jgi:hypothetical protein
MPITFTYDPARDLLLTKAEGLIMFADVQKHLECEAQRRALGYPELVDASHAWTNVTPEEVKQLLWRIQNEAQKGPFGPTAIVTKSDHLFGMARMLGILSELRGGPPVAVFRTQDEALAWLAGNAPPMTMQC